MMEMTLVSFFGIACLVLGIVLGIGISSWFWANHTATILDETMDDILHMNGLKRIGKKIVILGEDKHAAFNE